MSARAIELIRQASAELEANENSSAKYLRALTPRDGWRSNVHALVEDVVELLEDMGYSRNRIAALFDVHPVTLKDFIESGDKQRNQIPGWLFAAFARLPSEAWELVQREMLAWRTSVREATDAR